MNEINTPPTVQLKIFNHMGLCGDIMSVTHKEMQFRQISFTDLFHVFFPNNGEKAKTALKDCMHDICKSNWKKIDVMFDKYTFLVMHLWQELFKNDIWPSDFSSSCIKLFDFTALPQQGVICFRALSVMVKDITGLIGDDREWNDNMKALSAILSFHIFGGRLFAVENTVEMQNLLKNYAQSIVDKSLFYIFFVTFCLKFGVIFVHVLWHFLFI